MKALRFSSFALAASMMLVAGCNDASKTDAAAPATPATAKTDATPSIAPSANEPKHAWSDQEILTCTVSQCWQLAGRDEEKFFDIVQQLAVLSAKNRALMLPEDEKAGQKAGEYIKSQAKSDHDQLLFAVVDGAVRKVGTPETTAAAK